MERKTWNQTVEELFADEDKLATLLREFKSAEADTEAILGFINYAVENNWECPVVDGYLINSVTGERIRTKELRIRYNQSKVKNKNTKHMQDEVLEIFDRTAALYQTIIDKLKERNAWALNQVQCLRVTVNERNEEIKRLQTQLNDAALSDDEEEEEKTTAPDFIIDGGVGKMEIRVSNLGLIELIEQLDEFVKKNGYRAAINVLSANK